jgi:hypothetical protein
MADKQLEEESLRLLKAFYSLRDPRVRAIILDLVEETAADGRSVVEASVDRSPRRTN